MKWIELNSPAQLTELKKESSQSPVLIFKHSRRCNISRASLDRLERNWNEQEMQQIKPYFLDLLSYREISNQVAETFHVEHESPQILLIKDGQSVLDLSHFEIEYDQIKSAIKN